MHLFMVFTALGLALIVRLGWTPATTTWQTRWNRTLGAFLFSPLLLITSAIAIFCMGPRGQMVRWWEGWGSYALAIGFLVSAIATLTKLAIEAWQGCDRVQQLPQRDLQDTPARLMDLETPFIAQVGFWNPELVVSQGLLDTLDEEHLQAVLVHEQAHYHYQDTFWFFWLGWLKRLTIWLPQTETLWQELLILRELRADHWAAKQTDSLLLAEALLSVVSAPYADELYAALSSPMVRDRLTERIDALLDESNQEEPSQINVLIWLPLVLMPFIVVPFHF
jgi:Zn-dependent protease with chaperone function